MKRLLVVVDYQNDFVVGPLGYPEAASLLPRIHELIAEFEKAGDEVVFTRDVHDENYLHTEEGRNLPIPHCLRGSQGALLYGDLEKIAAKHLVIEKHTFPSDTLLDYVKKGTYREIVLCGLDLAICLISNAIICKAGAPDAHIVVDLSASATWEPAAKKYAVEEMHKLQIETTEEKNKEGLLH